MFKAALLLAYVGLSAAAADPPAATTDRSYLIQKTDVLRLGLPPGAATDQRGWELLQKARLQTSILVDYLFLVEDDGTVNLEAFGKAKVAGMSVATAQEAVANRIASACPDRALGEWIRKELTVRLAASHPESIYLILDRPIIGYPRNPTYDDLHMTLRICLSGKVTLADLFATYPELLREAEGAGVYHSRPDGAQSMVDWKKAIKYPRTTANFLLEPGDIITITRCIEDSPGLCRCVAPLERLFGITFLDYKDESWWSQAKGWCRLGE